MHAALLATALGGCTLPPAAADDLVATARRSLTGSDPARQAALALAARSHRAAHQYARAAELSTEVAAARHAAWESGRSRAAADAAAVALHRSGEDLELVGRHAHAAFQYERAVAVQDESTEAAGRLRVDLLWSSGRLLTAAGDARRGAERLAQALAAAQGLDPPAPRAAARIRYSLGLIKIAVGSDQEAFRLLREAGDYYTARHLNLDQVFSDAEASENVLIHVAQAQILRRAGQSAVGEARLERLLGGLKRLIHGELEGVFRCELGMTKLALGKVAEAEAQFAIAAGRADPGRPGRPLSEAAVVPLALVRGVALGRPAADLAPLRALVERRLRDLTLGFDYQNDRQRLAAFAAARPELDAYLTLAARGEVPAAEVYEVVAAWKGAVFARSVADAAGAGGDQPPDVFPWLLLAAAWPHPPVTWVARAAHDDRRGAVRRLRDLRAELAATATELRLRRAAAGPPGAEDRRLADLTTRFDRLGREYAAVAASVIGSERARVSPAEIAAALPVGCALVDYFAYAHYSPAPATRHPSGAAFRTEVRVLAFVARPGLPVACVRLARTADEIGEIADAWRAALPQWDESGTGPVPALRAKAGEMAAAVWAPLAPHLDGARALVVSPDGPLWRFSFAALPGTGPGHYLVQDLPVAHALSGRHARDMFARPAPARPGRGVLIVGDVDYGPVRPDRAGDLENLRGGAAWLEWAARAAALPGRPEPQLLSGAAATGGRVLPALGGGHREVILFAHGPAAEPGINADVFPMAAMWWDAAPRPRVRFSDPAYVYLPLANSNGQPPGGPDKPPPGDVLTLDMAGVRVVWCWACDSSAGPAVFAEGNIGFTRAFLLAGSRAVLTSFVAVGTDATAAFSRLAHRCVWDKGLSPAAALRSVQLHYISDPHRAHPYYWAPWLLVGDAEGLGDPPAALDPEFEAPAAHLPPPPAAAPPPVAGEGRVAWILGAAGLCSLLVAALVARRAAGRRVAPSGAAPQPKS